MRQHPPGVTVVGNASVAIATTHVRLSIAVESLAATAAPALDDNAVAARRLLESVSTAGVPDARVRTLGLTLDAHWGDGQVITGYVARQRFAIAAADVATVSNLLNDLSSVLGDRLRVEGVEMVQEHSPEAVRAAEHAAYEDAAVRAAALAADAGRALGQVASVSVESGESGGGPGPRAMAAAKASMAPGEGSLSANVRVTWEWE
ncbi:SIMPL domain-containing protein [Calidifontibacter terrae]